MTTEAMKTGRNRPCPCGSNKKFKRCCFNPQNITPALIPPTPPVDHAKLEAEMESRLEKSYLLTKHRSGLKLTPLAMLAAVVHAMDGYGVTATKEAKQ